MCRRFLKGMTFGALEHGKVAEVQRMLKRFVRLVAKLAFAVGETAQVDGMLERPGGSVLGCRPRRVVEDRMTNVAIIPDHLAALAFVLAVMTAETSG